MSLVSFYLSKEKKEIKIVGSEFNLDSFKNFFKKLEILEQDANIREVRIFGNFDSEFMINDMLEEYSKNNNLDEILSLLQSITKAIEKSRIIFISHISSTVKGPALEIALSCKKIIAKKNSILKFNELEKGLMPFLGSVQRLLRLVGYKKALEVLLIKKSLTYSEIKKYSIFNKADLIIDMSKQKILRDIEFTNTFIHYNSVIHAKTKNNLPVYNAILSSIYEGCICEYEASLSIEKKWLKWLLKKL